MSNPYNDGGTNPFSGDNNNAGGSGGGGTWYDPPSASAAAAESPSYSLPSDSTPPADVGAQPQWSSAGPSGGGGGGGGAQPNWVDSNASAPTPGQQQQQGPVSHSSAKELDTWKCWELAFYQQFFDVDTQDVLRRMGNVMLPLVPPDFLHDRHWHMGGAGGSNVPAGIASAAAAYGGTSEKRADLYGPFWVTTTLWIVLAVVGNIMSKLAYNRHLKEYNFNIEKMMNGTSEGQHLFTPEPPKKWVYNFEAASVGATVTYFYVVFMSLLVWGLMKWKNVPVGFTDSIALYGYSMFVWILGAILCAVPSTAFQWLVCVVAGVWSCGYLLLNMWQLWKVTLEKPWFFGLVILVSAAQFAMVIGFKLYFFDYAV